MEKGIDRSEKKTIPDQQERLVDSETLKQLIKSSVAKLGPQVSKEEKKEQAKLLMKIFQKGMSPKEATGITNEEISQIYSYAYHLFSIGKYIESLELFKMLMVLDPFERLFATALGVCYHRLKDYENALRCYMLSAYLNISDPVPLFYAYDCFLNMHDETAANIMLCNVIARAGEQNEYTKIKEKAQALYEALKIKVTANL